MYTMGDICVCKHAICLKLSQLAAQIDILHTNEIGTRNCPLALSITAVYRIDNHDIQCIPSSVFSICIFMEIPNDRAACLLLETPLTK